MLDQLKILLIGPPKSGKTSLLQRLTLDEFDSEYFPTLSSDFSVQEFIIDENKTDVSTQIWDIGGSTPIGKAYTKDLDGVILVIDATKVSKDNTDTLDTAYEKLVSISIEQSSHDITFPFLVVVNKIDLLPENESYDLSNIVNWMIKKRPTKPENINIMACSAYSGYNVTEMFETMIRSILDNKKPAISSITSSSSSPTTSNESKATPPTSLLSLSLPSSSSSSSSPSKRLSLRSPRASITGAILPDGTPDIPSAISLLLSKQNHILAKIVLVGSAGCGKTSLLSKFLDESKELFLEYSPTVGTDLRVKEMTVKDRSVSLQLWDTAGNQNAYNIGRTIYKNADGAIFMYDITSQDSFKELIFHWDNFMKYANPEYFDDYPIVLVGAKSDLSGQRAVSMDEVLRWCTKQRPSAPVTYIETSSLLGNGVNDVFICIADNVVNNILLDEEYLASNEEYFLSDKFVGSDYDEDEDKDGNDGDLNGKEDNENTGGGDDDEDRESIASSYVEEVNELNKKQVRFIKSSKKGQGNQDDEDNNSDASSADIVQPVTPSTVPRTKTNTKDNDACWTPFTFFGFEKL